MIHPYTVSLLLADGITEGLKIIEKSNWNGRGFACPRTLFPRHKIRDDLKKPGIYLLCSHTDDRQGGKRVIGEGDPLLSFFCIYPVLK